MEYELAERLKDAGFLQREVGYEQDPYLGNYLNKEKESGFYENAYSPSLSELIEACGAGKGQFNMVSSPAGWSCDFKKMWGSAYPDAVALNYPTPEEAVAHLWLELNKK